MKRPKKLTRDQKKAVEAAMLLPESWMLAGESDFYLKIVHKTSGRMRRIDRYAIPKKGVRE